MARAKSAKQKPNGATLGFEATMWAAAAKLWGRMNAAEGKPVVVGFVFLKYISASFKRLHARLGQVAGADPEDPDEYRPRRLLGDSETGGGYTARGMRKPQGRLDRRDLAPRRHTAEARSTDASVEPILLTDVMEEKVRVIAGLVEVLPPLPAGT